MRVDSLHPNPPGTSSKRNDSSQRNTTTAVPPPYARTRGGGTNRKATAMSPEPPLMPGGFRPEGRTVMSTLEILGQSHNGDALWVRINDDDEFDVTPVELAVARRSVQRGYSGRLGGHWVDESQLDTLINAMNAPQPLYPPIACRFCGVDASLLIEDLPYCHSHATGYAAREEGQ